MSSPTKLKLIREPGKNHKSSNNHIKSTNEFIRSVVYPGEYLSIQRLGFVNPDSVEKAHWQIFKWLRCWEQNAQS